MKLIKISVALCLLSNVIVFAQSKGTSQINVGVPLGSNLLISEGFSNDLFSGNAEEEETNSVIAFNLTFKNAISAKFMLGGTVAYEKIESSLDKNRTANFTTIAIESDYRYISNEYFQMYSGLGVGYTFANEKPGSGTSDDDSYGLFNCQLSALGFRVGKSFAGYAEFGFGYKGIINLGASIQF